MQSDASAAMSFSFSTAIARFLHLLAGFARVVLLYFTFGASALTAVYTPVGRAEIEILMWVTPEVLALTFWAWTGVFIYGPNADRSFPASKWLFATPLVLLLVAFVFMEVPLLLGLPRELSGALAVLAFLGPFILLTLGSNILAGVVRREAASSQTLVRLLACLALGVPLAMAVAAAFLQIGDSLFFLTLPVAGTWGATVISVGLHLFALGNRARPG